MIQLTREEVQQVLKFVHRVTHWEEGRPDRNDTLKLLQSKLAEQCFCDRNNLGKPGVSCGDCPTRDYKTEKDDGEPVTAQAAAIRTLTFLGYTYHGAEQWKPPLGKTPEPVAYLAWRDGKPCWDEDCVCQDAVYPVDSDDDRTSMPVYLHPAPRPMTDFDIRGKLSTLKCWHRLSGDEVQDLIEFAQNQQSK